MVAGKSSNTQWALRQLWKKCGVELHQRGLSSVFMTVDVPEPVRGRAVKQSAEMRSALEFFATAQSFRERSLESVN